MQAFQVSCDWINDETCVLQGNQAQNRLGIRRAKNNLGHCFRAHERDSTESILVFHGLMAKGQAKRNEFRSTARTAAP